MNDIERADEIKRLERLISIYKDSKDPGKIERVTYWIGLVQMLKELKDAKHTGTT